jgi:hypothetical protein
MRLFLLAGSIIDMNVFHFPVSYFLAVSETVK